VRAKKRVGYARKILEEIGVEGERVEMFNLSAAMGSKFAEIAKEMTKRIEKLGRSPLKVKDAEAKLEEEIKNLITDLPR
jgi:coenzyme F420-reducing hydrogenase delta subunit